MAYFAVIALFVLAVLVAGGFVAASHLFGPKRPGKIKLAPYECGVDPVSSPRQRFGVKYYVIALLFLLFDLETVFIVPWAVIYRGALAEWGAFIFFEMLVFIGVLALGLIYVWKKGALEWE